MWASPHSPLRFLALASFDATLSQTTQLWFDTLTNGLAFVIVTVQAGYADVISRRNWFRAVDISQ